MKISQVADLSGCHLETIRYYERIGLIPAPHRNSNGYREYQDSDVERLRFIGRSRDLGFNLEQIRSLLDLAHNPALSCVAVATLAREHLQDIQTRIADLQRMELELERTIDTCQLEVRQQCTILGALQQ